MKKYLLFCLLIWPLSVSAQSDDTDTTSTLPERPIRAQRPHSVTFGGLWPRGVGFEYQYQPNPSWGLGAYMGTSIFNVTGGLFSRWYQSPDPATWYLEALLNGSLFGGTTPYTFGSPAIGANGLIGWEYRSREGFIIRVGTGLGLSTFTTANAISPGLMLQLNLDAAIGYAF